MRNARHAERVNVRAGARAVTLKIPLKFLLALRAGEFVGWLCEMVHANINVLAVRREFFDDELEHLQLCFRRGQDFAFENFLRRFDPRHMRVAEHGEPVGLHRQHGIERFIERFRRLKRQAINQVEVDGAEAEFTHPIHRLLRHLARLDAVNRLLHFRVEILHAH